MGKAGLTSIFRVALAATATAAFVQLQPEPASSDDTVKAGLNLELNPKLARPLPPPGWISDHRDTWPQEHPVYKETCRKPAVVDEIRFMNRVVGYDIYLIKVTQSYIADAVKMQGASAPQHADLAMATLESLRNDIAAADSLVNWLQWLPDCPTGTPAPPTAASIASTEAAPVMTVSAPTAPSTAGTPSAPSTNNAIPIAVASAPEPKPSDQLVIRFDDRIAALTPSGVRSFDQAIEALRGGKKVQLAIEGCDPAADYSNGSSCARRLLSLKELLAQNGVRDVKRLLAGIR
jgi:hypothetical protein